MKNWRLYYEDKFNHGNGFDWAHFFHIKAEVACITSFNALPGNTLQTQTPSVSFHMVESAGIIMVFAAKNIIAWLPRAGFLLSIGKQEAKTFQDYIFKHECWLDIVKRAMSRGWLYYCHRSILYFELNTYFSDFIYRISSNNSRPSINRLPWIIAPLRPKYLK